MVSFVAVESVDLEAHKKQLKLASKTDAKQFKAELELSVTSSTKSSQEPSGQKLAGAISTKSSQVPSDISVVVNKV